MHPGIRFSSLRENAVLPAPDGPARPTYGKMKREDLFFFFLEEKGDEAAKGG